MGRTWPSWRGGVGVCAVVAMLAAGCAPEVDLGADDSDGGPSEAAGHRGDSDAASDAAGLDPNRGPAFGTVSFVTDNLSSHVSAVGADFTLSAGPTGCTQRLEGTCTIVSCPSVAAEGPLTYVAAGALSFSGFVTPLEPSPSDGDPVAYQASQSGTLWAAGETVEVSATGGRVPAFKASLVFPAPLELTSPATVSTISKSAGVSLSWQEANDYVSVFFSQLTSTGAIVDISCAVSPPSVGYTLTPSTLADVVAGSTDNVLMVGTYRSSQVTAGSCQIDVEAQADYGHYYWPVGITE
jgi:hypothetical protein